MVTLSAYVSLIVFIILILCFVGAGLILKLLNAMINWNSIQNVLAAIGIAFIVSADVFLILVIIFAFVNEIGC